MNNSRHDFSRASKPKTPPPFSLRLTFEERAALEKAANGVPLGAYIKSVLFSADLPAVRRRGTRPVKDHQELARVLAQLGGSRLASNLHQLSKAVNTASLPVNAETEADLRQACADVRAIREALIRALGLGGAAP